MAIVVQYPTIHAPMAMDTATFTSVRLRLNQSPRLTPGTPMATVVSTGHIPMDPTTHAPIAMVATTFTSVRLRLNQSPRLTPGTPMATAVSTDHTPMEPTTHAPMAMDTAFGSV